MRILVLGGGLSGLTAAYELCKRGHDVLVIEKERGPGGLARSFEVKWDGENFSIPCAYHHLLVGDSATYELIRELGFRGKVSGRG